MNDAIIVDLDGTLALFDRDKVNPYRRDFSKDIPNAPVIKLCRWASQAGMTVLVLSGRDAEFEQETVNWLKAHKVPYNFLYMRPQGDHRHDTEVKHEMYLKYVHLKYVVQFCVDDRPKMVRFWREVLGLPVFHVTGWDDDF